MAESKYTVPNDLERELAAAVTAVGADEATIADALAAHRERCTTLVTSMLEQLAKRGMSEHALELFAHGYTPERVHTLVFAYRTKRNEIRETSALVRELLERGTAAEPKGGG